MTMPMRLDGELLAWSRLPTEVLNERLDQHLDALMEKWREMPDKIRNAPPIDYLKHDLDSIHLLVDVLWFLKQPSVDKLAPAELAAAALPLAPAVTVTYIQEWVPCEVGSGKNKRTILLSRRRPIAPG